MSFKSCIQQSANCKMIAQTWINIMFSVNTWLYDLFAMKTSMFKLTHLLCFLYLINSSQRRYVFSLNNMSNRSNGSNGLIDRIDWIDLFHMHFVKPFRGALCTHNLNSIQNRHCDQAAAAAGPPLYTRYTNIYGGVCLVSVKQIWSTWSTTERFCNSSGIKIYRDVLNYTT